METPDISTMEKNQGAIIEVKAYVVNPMADITFTASQPLAYPVSNEYKFEYNLKKEI